jgi:acid phosphatase class B
MREGGYVWHNFRFALLSLVFVVSMFGTLHAAEGGANSREKVTGALETKYVTVDTIRQSLPSTPIIAGFDIDDTVACFPFSKPVPDPGFHP